MSTTDAQVRKLMDEMTKHGRLGIGARPACARSDPELPSAAARDPHLVGKVVARSSGFRNAPPRPTIDGGMLDTTGCYVAP